MRTAQCTVSAFNSTVPSTKDWGASVTQTKVSLYSEFHWARCKIVQVKAGMPDSTVLDLLSESMDMGRDNC